MSRSTKPHRGHPIVQPLVRRIIPEWTDYNSHLNVSWFVYLFDLATDNMLDAFGIGKDYAERTFHSTFALEAHVRYLGEVKEGDDVVIRSFMIAADKKKIHYYHEMSDSDSHKLFATLEQISIHVDLSVGLSSEWPDDIRQRLNAAVVEGKEGLKLCESIGLHSGG